MSFIQINTGTKQIDFDKFDPIRDDNNTLLKDRQNAYLVIDFVKRHNGMNKLEEYIYQKRRDNRRNPLELTAEDLIEILSPLSYNIQSFGQALGLSKVE
jgi:hypothetical protein